jgi:adenosylhomocysteine nucleosidase
MTVLAVVPTSRELEALTGLLAERGHEASELQAGRLSVWKYAGGRLLVAHGGLGKVQFGLHTQHLLDNVSGVRLVICAGTAGGLSPDVAVGDVVVASTTIEHDFNTAMFENPRPSFDGDETAIAALKTALEGSAPGFAVRFGTIVSRDESIVESARAAEIHRSTGALAAAWEGAGGARASGFCETPFLEVRGISDGANESAPDEFVKNVPIAMKSVATVLGMIAGLPRDER